MCCYFLFRYVLRSNLKSLKLNEFFQSAPNICAFLVLSCNPLSISSHLYVLKHLRRSQVTPQPLKKPCGVTTTSRSSLLLRTKPYGQWGGSHDLPLCVSTQKKKSTFYSSLWMICVYVSRLWDRSSMEEVKTLKFDTSVSSMECMADGEILVITYGKTIAFYNALRFTALSSCTSWQHICFKSNSFDTIFFRSKTVTSL